MSTIRPVATLLTAAALLLPATAQPLHRPAAPRALAPQSRPYQRSGKFVRHHGRLHVFDTQLIDQQGGKIVLRGLSLGWYSHNINLDEAKEFFQEISQTYGKYPNIIYEAFNKPDYESWDEVKAHSEEVIKVIRANDPNNVILVGCPHWDQDIRRPAANPIKGYKNLMHTVRFYAVTHGKWLRDRTDEAMKNGYRFSSPNRRAWKLPATAPSTTKPGRRTSTG